jgi:ABC-type multidrug transport system fused ATPase/permease subunit
MDKSYIILGLIAIAAILLVISLFKKAVKFALFILVIIVGIGLVDIFVYGVSPVDEFNAYVTNFKYGKGMTELTGDISSSAGNIKNIIETNKLDSSSVETLKKENENLHNYREQLKKLEHTSKLNGFHSTYSGYLETIIAISDKTVELSSGGSKTLGNVQEMLGNIKGAINNLVGLKY